MKEKKIFELKKYGNQYGYQRNNNLSWKKASIITSRRRKVGSIEKTTTWTIPLVGSNPLIVSWEKEILRCIYRLSRILLIVEQENFICNHIEEGCQSERIIHQLTAAERRDSDRKRSTPMIIPDR